MTIFDVHFTVDHYIKFEKELRHEQEPEVAGNTILYY
jgi:hypothetical protein